MRRVNQSEQYQFLVAPVLWTATMGIKRLFENLEIPVRIVGAGTLDAALNQIRKNPNYSALIIDWDEAGSSGVELACAVKEETQLPIVVFQKNWKRDDLRRALQLGVDVLFPSSFSPHDLFTELQTLKETGQSPSRARILHKTGEELLQPDPELWTNQAENWRDRMMGLADQLIRPWSEETTNRASHLESTVIRGSEFDEIPIHMARAMLEVVECGRDKLPEISQEYRIPATELSKMLNAMEDFCRKHGGLGKLPLLIDEMIKKNTVREAQLPPQLSLLHRVSRVVIRAQGKSSHRQDAMNETIKKFMGIPLGLLNELSTEHRFKLALGLLNIDHFDKAVDRIGYFVISVILKRLRREKANQLDIIALNSLLGFDARYNSIQVKSLVRSLAILNPIPSLHFVDLADIKLALPLLEQMEFENGIALHSAIEQLAEMGRPMGPIDQKRLRDLLNAVKYELPVLIARPTWISLYRLLVGEANAELEHVKDRFLFIVGARKQVAKERLIQALRGLIEVGRHVMDAARFAELCRNATMGRLDTSLIQDYVDDICEEFTIPPANRVGAAEQRAVLEQAYSGLVGFDIDIDGVKDNLPPRLTSMPDLSPLEEARLRVMAAGIDLTEAVKHLPLVQHYLRGHKLHPEEMTAIETLVGEFESLIEIRKTLVDNAGAFREGYDEALEESMIVDLHLDDVDFGEQENWDDDILAVADDVIKGAAFSHQKTAPPKAASSLLGPPSRKKQTISEPVDLGLDELEMELDLEGGSLNASFDHHANLLEETTSPATEMWNRTQEWNPPLDLPERPINDTREFPRVYEANVTGQRSVGRPNEVNEQEFQFDPFAEALSTPAHKVSIPIDPPEDEELDLVKVRRMLKTGQLSAVVKYLNAFNDDTESLVEALNLTALQSYIDTHYRAASILWQRALSINPDYVNLHLNYARLLIKQEQLREAGLLLAKFLKKFPHFTPALELQKMVPSEALEPDIEH